MLKRINIGCGQTITSGWDNYDNSLSIKFARFPLLVKFLYKFRIISNSHKSYMHYCMENKILYADATTKLPIEDNNVSVIYSSHMLEHISRKGVVIFLQEAKRVLAPKGIIRLVLPDLRIAIEKYNKHKDADKFMDAILVKPPPIDTFWGKIKLIITGYRHHQNMYDGQSLAKLLEDNGFIDVTIVEAGSTMIQDPGLLDLYERSDESVYVEAKKSS